MLNVFVQQERSVQTSEMGGQQTEKWAQQGSSIGLGC